MGVIQVEQDLAVCATKFPALKCRPIAAQFLADDLIALFELHGPKGAVSIKDEKHYSIVVNKDLSDEEIVGYRVQRDET